MKYEAEFLGKKITYEGSIRGLGEYPDSNNNDYMIWFGECDKGFIYIPYKKDEEFEEVPLVCKNLSIVFRYCKPFKTIKEAIKNCGLNLFLNGEKSIDDKLYSSAVMGALKCEKQHLNDRIYDVEGSKEFISIS